MSQTLAILNDAYRELNARKMFWISLGISMLVVLVFACVGINERGIVFFWRTFDNDFMNTGIVSRSLFYKGLFNIVGLEAWLGFGATVLALVSTASIIPDFVSSGAIQSMLARPISRTRLFLIKYFASLLFVVLQGLVFTTACIFVIGLRGGVWLWSLMLAVPVITLFFSYIYCVSALVGVWTRSTLASLLAGLALWGGMYVIDLTEVQMLRWKVGTENKAPLNERDIDALVLLIAREKEKSDDPANYAKHEKRLEEKRADFPALQEDIRGVNRWYNLVYTAKAMMPKSGETKTLLNRAVIADREMEKMVSAAEDRNSREGGIFGAADMRTAKQVDKLYKSRSIWWVVGTSLLFEGVILALACRIFVKRDF